MPTPSRALRADALLLVTALLWGLGFVPQRSAMEHVGPLTFNAARFAIGALAMIPLIVVARRIDLPTSASRRAPTMSQLIAGTVLGLVTMAGATLQQAGIAHTTASRAGFITGLYAVLVPILGMAFGQRTARLAWLGAAMATLGMILLGASGSGSSGEVPSGRLLGDLLVLGAAVAWAMQVIVVGFVAAKTNALFVAFIQFMVVAALSCVGAWAGEDPTIADMRAAGWEILYSGFMAIGAAFTLQLLAQRDAPPAHAGVIMAFEAVFAALFGWVLLNERLGPIEMLGCGVMFAAMIVVQFGRVKPHAPGTPPLRGGSGDRGRTEPSAA